MKLLKHIIRAGALCGLLLTTAAAKAQTVQLKVLDWNVLSFEMTDKSNQIDFIVDEYVDLIKAQNPDIVCINELETGTSRMGKEKLTELASRLDMYPYFIMSYPKDVGFYGNGILSKYPIGKFLLRIASLQTCQRRGQLPVGIQAMNIICMVMTSEVWATSTFWYRPPIRTDRSCALSVRISTIAE